ncbi:HrpA-like RNA helicase [Phanerochaete sordida]|uniref:RNA helicase n=1 Tax=Phanerochaete sordida TaxID=48140 RepID=A0A9P3LCR1_9APHY|nr:HrpA-like RNA helicase [Phanerochaete sordida]
MASSLRDIVEESIKKAFELYPDAADSTPKILEDEQRPTLVKQLQTFGFSEKQANSAIKTLSAPSPLTSTLLSSFEPLQACLEYLILHVPECDLPQRFLPSSNSSNPFISSVHSGTEDIKARWAVDKAVKECGWPAHVVKYLVKDRRLVEDWGLLQQALNRALVGAAEEDISLETEATETEALDEDELSAYDAKFMDNTHLLIPLPVAPLELHVILRTDDRSIAVRGEPPAMYITSKTVAAYVRLHILSQLLSAFRNDTLVDPGESVIMAAVRFIEEQWASVEDHGPPEVSEVLRYFMRDQGQADNTEASEVTAATQGKRGGRQRKGGSRRDDRDAATIKAEFEELRQKKAYTDILAARKRLPAFAAQGTFLDMLDKNRCVIVVGETGCGKTTQLPQFVLDSLILAGHGSEASIIVTQPRRLSALGVAARVSTERLEDGSVGYAIRGESKQSNRTKLLFCTTGVVLRRLGSGDKLQNVTHVIVDEVHERSVDGDLLLLELKTLLQQNKRLKIILMSATINHEIFIKYFNNAPLLTIPGFTHPVEDRYLEEYLPSLSYRPSGKGVKRPSEKEMDSLRSQASSSDESLLLTLHAISKSDRVDIELIHALVKHIIDSRANPGGVLIFLPGVQEIHACLNALKSIPNAKVFPLHANLSSDEQRAVFAPTSGWKIIAATNVAETSITIDDVVYVIDSGKVKETQYDPENGLTKLEEQWVTRAAARQRRGRAGRTKPGVCYKLYTRRQESNMQHFPIPEIKRVALESVALSVKVTHDDVKGFLSRAIDPPTMSALDHALFVLNELGAISPEGDLTPMGQHLAMLPMEPRLGKMLVLGAIFQCLGPVLTAASIMSSKPLFVSPMDKREEASRARAKFATGNSDILTDVNAYEECASLREKGASRVRAFCEENFISMSTLRDITSLRQEFLSTLTSLNLVPWGSTPSSPALNTHSAHTGLVKAVLLGGLWPRVARVVLPKDAVKFDRVQAGTVQRANEAREYKFFDVRAGAAGGRVFLHPSSVLFRAAEWRSPFVAYFQKQQTTKLWLRDATEVPVYALLLFGGPVTVNHVGGGLTIGTKDAFVKLKAWPRIGVLVNQLRRLLDVQLKQSVDTGDVMSIGNNNPVVKAVLALLQNDGLSSDI